MEWKDGLETKEEKLMDLACRINFDCKSEVKILEKYTLLRPEELEFSKNFARSM
jgi:hypothetical protein